MLEVGDKVAFSLVRTQEVLSTLCFSNLDSYEREDKGTEEEKACLATAIWRRAFESGSIFHEVTQSQYLENFFKKN